jgi:signal peptidase II
MEAKVDRLSPSMRTLKKILGVLFLFSLIGCDHASKHMAKTVFEGQAPMALISGVLDLTYAENRGVAFSLLTELPHGVSRPLLVALNLIAVAVLFWLGRRSGWRGPLDKLAFVLVAAGALGNAFDRALRGYVVDFVHLHHWPVFNVADVLIVVGYGLFAISHWRRVRPEPAVAGAVPPTDS